ncbi:MAG: tetratricopeptide repeat protein, partial [Acidobacteriota bacterium]|nr:tetratricopeptide repeat protein [Acidobacteriota bacterium]
GLPGHFLVQYDDGAYSTFIDPFNGGRLLEHADPPMLRPVSKRQIIGRMINNLHGIYISQRSSPKQLLLLDLLIRADPDAAEEYKQRGLVHLQSRQMQAAKADLQKYLRLMPDAADRGEIERQLQAITRWLATMN